MWKEKKKKEKNPEKQGEQKQTVLQLNKLRENTGNVQWNWKGKKQSPSKRKLFKDNWMYVQALAFASYQ